METYLLEEFDMSFLDNPMMNGTLVFTDRAVQKEEWARLQRWRDPSELDPFRQPIRVRQENDAKA